MANENRQPKKNLSRAGRVVLVLACAASPHFCATAHADDYRRLLDAMRQVESGGNDRAVGDGGKSRGPYQIQRGYWADGGGKPADYDTLVYDRAACERVILGYWRRYCPKALAGGDEQALARTHNGGPAGPRMKATLVYWRRVKAAMEK